MYYGIDIGGTTAKVGVFKDAKLIDSWALDMKVKNASEMVSRILNSIKEKDDNILGIGIGCPGFIKNNIVRSSANLHFLDGVDLASEFKKQIDCPVRLINDANCHALGEAIYNNLDNIVFVSLGTGVGGGFVYNHQILEGDNGSFMEVGHLHVDDEYHLTCGCGNTGCLETVCGQKGINNLIQYYMGKVETKLPINYTVKDVFDLAKQNDPLCLKAVDIFADRLGLGLYNVASILNPSSIIIGGGISAAGEYLLNKIKLAYQKYTNDNLRETDIRLATLGPQAGMYGAYYLVTR